jgi:hypothetical protein
LLSKHLSDLEAYRNTRADQSHATLGLLNLLLDFVKKTYATSRERHSTLSAVSLSSSSLPLATTYDFLTLPKPVAKIVKNPESKIAGAYCPGDIVPSMSKYWDDMGWELITEETPDLSYNLYASSDVAFSDTSPDDSSSGTSFESGSEMTDESAGLETNYPVTPITTPVLVSGDQELKMALSMTEFRRGLENALKDAHLVDS